MRPSYEQVIKLEQDRLVYQARLHSRFGRAWHRKAPVESLMPLRLARYGVALSETASSGLAAGIEPALLPPAPVAVEASVQAPAVGAAAAEIEKLHVAPEDSTRPRYSAMTNTVLRRASSASSFVPCVRKRAEYLPYRMLYRRLCKSNAAQASDAPYWFM